MDIPNQEKYRENSKKKVDIDTRRVLKRKEGDEWRKFSQKATHPYNTGG